MTGSVGTHGHQTADVAGLYRVRVGANYHNASLCPTLSTMSELTADTDAAFCVCCFCGRDVGAHGNNPSPLDSYPALCCDVCNAARVIPARLAARVIPARLAASVGSREPVEPLPNTWELSGLECEGPKPTLREAAAAFLRKNHKKRNSMFALEQIAFAEGARNGEVMLSWWLDAPGMLLIKQVMLLPAGAEPRDVLTTTADALLADPELHALGLRTVRVEAVLTRRLLLKLEGRGWKLEGRACNILSGNADKSVS